MKRSKIQKYEMLTRVDDFVIAHAELFPKHTAIGDLQEAIHSAIEKLSGHLTAQVSGNNEVRVSMHLRIAARNALRVQLSAVEQTARALKLQRFWLPTKRSDQALFSTGETFIADAEPLKDQFVLQGLPHDFIEKLKISVLDLKAAISSQTQARAARKASISLFDKTLEEAWQYFQRFEALVANTMSDNPAVIAAWDVASHMNKAGGGSKTNDETETASAIPPTAVAPAPVTSSPA